MGEPIRDMLKTNTSLKYLMLYELGLTDWTATHIAAGLVDNHSLEKLGISKNKTTSVGAASIFKALEFNNTLKSLDISINKLRCRLHSPHSSSPQLHPVLPPSLPSTLPTQTTTSHSPSLSLLEPPSPSPVTTQDGCVGLAMARMLHCNRTLTDLDVTYFGLTPQCSVAVFNALQNNLSLKKLHMACNELDTEALAGMLLHNHSLTELDIRGCDLHPKVLARGLLHNTTLTKVEVNYKHEKESIIAALVELRRQEGHTEQPDPVVSSLEKVINGLCVLSL